MSTCTIEEKIIQRQLSKEGLQNIVEDKEQVNLFSSDELKALFDRRTDSRSDTHDTLRCKKCLSVKALRGDGNKASSSAALSPAHIEECSLFLETFMETLVSTAEEKNAVDAITPYLQDFHSLLGDLRNGSFATLPLFSRAFRGTVTGVDREIEVQTL